MKREDGDMSLGPRSDPIVLEVQRSNFHPVSSSSLRGGLLRNGTHTSFALEEKMLEPGNMGFLFVPLTTPYTPLSFAVMVP